MGEGKIIETKVEGNSFYSGLYFVRSHNFPMVS